MNKVVECLVHDVNEVTEKRRLDESDSPPPVLPQKKRRVLHVTWSDKNEVHHEEPIGKLFNDYKETDIWYTRKEYDEFLVDRIRTVQCLRASGGDEKVLDPQFYCVRGLEPFQTEDVHEELHSNRRFHHSTILVEQVRQSLLGLRDPDRFRFLVAPHSEMALRRAQQLAALDEHEVYGKVCRRQSLMASSPPTAKTSSTDDPMSLSLNLRIRRLQEWNARRLMEIYSQPGKSPFRFNIRRDSLVGSHAGRLTARDINNRFPIRRDSLTPMGSVKR